jgi:hypothetical protein
VDLFAAWGINPYIPSTSKSDTERCLYSPLAPAPKAALNSIRENDPDARCHDLLCENIPRFQCLALVCKLHLIAAEEVGQRNYDLSMSKAVCDRSDGCGITQI